MSVDDQERTNRLIDREGLVDGRYSAAESLSFIGVGIGRGYRRENRRGLMAWRHRIAQFFWSAPTFSGRTLIHFDISDTLKWIVIVECWSTRRQSIREASMGYLLHPHLECDSRRMRQRRIAKRDSGRGRIREPGGESAGPGRERHTCRIRHAGAGRASHRPQSEVASGSSRHATSDKSRRPLSFCRGRCPVPQ